MDTTSPSSDHLETDHLEKYARGISGAVHVHPSGPHILQNLVAVSMYDNVVYYIDAAS